MISARFLLRSLSLRHASFFLALLAVTVAATLAATLLGIRADMRVKMSGEVLSTQSAGLILPGRTSQASRVTRTVQRSSPSEK